MAIPTWNAGTLYQPGDIVQPNSAGQITQTSPTNSSFESGVLTGWTASYQFGTGSFTVLNTPPPDMSPNSGAYQGTWFVEFAADPGGSGPRGSVYGTIKNDLLAPVRPGQTINFSVKIARNASPKSSSWSNGGAKIIWLNESEEEIGESLAVTSGSSDTPAGMVGGDDSAVAWKTSAGTGVAPPGAAYAQAAIIMTDNDAGGSGIWADDFQWDYAFQGLPDGLLFRAVQPQSGFSGATEPVWPIVSGESVYDNEVIWEALFASRVTWQASPILVSGTVEPVWPTAPGGTILDGTINWEATDGRITDEKCPQSKIVAIAASKIFAGDDDIVAYSATVNPRDWSSENDAGYIPFGLNTYGSNPVAAMDLYRSNLVVFNSEGYQMWQVDPNPVNIAILDAQPVPCEYHLAKAAVANDLVMLTSLGIRSVGIAGASTNLQAGFFGKAVDPLVKPLLQAAVAAGYDPMMLTWPAAGQAWVIFGTEAIVLTINGPSKAEMSWSRYVFPAEITDWCIDGTALFLRAGTAVWEVSDEANETTLGCCDDVGGSPVPFDGYMAWQYLDLGPIGIDKQLEGLDLVITGLCDISIGYDQRVGQEALATSAYTVDGDTLPGVGLLPFPMTAPSFQVRLTFDSAEPWTWYATNIYKVGEYGT
jgi:hypothetical protein